MSNEVTRREAIKTLTSIAAVSGVGWHATAAVGADHQGSSNASEKSNAEDLPWYRRLLVGVEWGPTGGNDDPDFVSEVTGKEIIENCIKAQAEYVVVFLKDSHAYYNSTVAHKYPGMGERDLLQECVDAARPHNMPVVAYCQVQYDGSAWNAHPEWRMKDQNGNDIGGRLCYRSGYLEFIKQVAAEMMEYEIQGFHFDMLDFGFGGPTGCWCDTCKRDFRKQHGIDLPKTGDAWDKMLQFRCDSNTQFCQQLDAFVKSKRPDVAVDYNYHGSPPFSWHVGERPVQHSMNGDFVTAEGLPWIFGHNNPSLVTLFMKGARPDGLVQGVTSPSASDYHDFTVRPLAELKWEVMTYLAHGAQCTIVDKAGYDGRSDAVVYDRLGIIFGEAKKKREYFGHRPVQEVGVYYSSRSQDWYGREDAAKYQRAFWGAHKALVQSHIPMGFIMDESASLERLQSFPVVYLPNAVILSDREVELLDQYVIGGGRLLITGLTGIGDRHGNLQDHSMISELVGALLVRCQTDHPDNYVRLPKSLEDGKGKFVIEDIPSDWPFLTWGPIAVMEPTSAEAFGELMVARRTQNNQWAHRMSPDKAVGPAVMVNQRGKGKVIYSPCAIDEAFASEYRVPEHRNLIRNLIRHLNPRPQVVVDAPRNVEIVVTHDEDRNRILVHFLCFYAPATSATAGFGGGRRVLPPQMEEEMFYKARVQVNRPFTGADVVGRGSRLTTEQRDIEFETSVAHEVLVIRL